MEALDKRTAPVAAAISGAAAAISGVARVSTAALLVMGAGLLAGCAQDTEGASDSSADGGAGGAQGDGGTDDGGNDGGNDGGSSGGGAPTAATAGITGQVVDPDGAPLAGVRVNLCHGVCHYVDTDDAGRFSITKVDAGHYALSVALLGDDTGLTHALFMVDLPADSITTVDTPIPMARLGPGQELTTAAEVQLAEGLWVSADPAGADLSDGDTLTLAAGLPATLPPLLPVEADAVLTVIYLDPFDVRIEPGMGLRLANTWGLTGDDAVRVYVASFADYDWLDAGSLALSADGAELSGGELPVISTVVVARGP